MAMFCCTSLPNPSDVVQAPSTLHLTADALRERPRRTPLGWISVFDLTRPDVLYRVAHRLEPLRGMTDPVNEFADDHEWLAAAE